MKTKLFLLWTLSLFAACEIVDNDMDRHVKPDVYVSLDEVAGLMAALPMERVHLCEVHDAVSASSRNGYDEEYTMANLFTVPGAGIGDEGILVTRGDKAYESPLRGLIRDYLCSMVQTKSVRNTDPESWLDFVAESDMQIYWPYSENWDGETYPVLTFDPEDGSEVNIGYKLLIDENGFRHVEEVVVDEALAQRQPVWVINRNSDSRYMSLEMLRKRDPDWGEGGGSIIVTPGGATRASSSGRSLILKSFTAGSHHDSWFAGAAEYILRLGALENFTASTEAELRLYNPLVTEFMVKVKRSQVKIPQELNVLLVSDWTDQMETCAFMITEDDGGTIKEWECTALVRVASRSYGIELKLPFYSYDDIIWRGSVARKWLDGNEEKIGHFGDIDLTFEVMEY